MKKKILLMIMFGGMVMGLLGCVPKKNAKLVSFGYYSGGGMEGGGSATSVALINDKVYLTEEKKEWWYQDPAVSEYVVDSSILSKIESVYRKHGMHHWNNKKFTNMFVEDGPSYSYQFSFDNNYSTRFSSQIYPKKFRNKLSEIQNILKEYSTGANAEPGLVLVPNTPEEEISRHNPQTGKVEIKVYNYRQNMLSYRFQNGTDNDIEISEKVKITDSNGSVFFEQSKASSFLAYSHSCTEESITLDERFPGGNYTLFIGDYSTSFEIKKPE